MPSPVTLLRTIAGACEVSQAPRDLQLQGCWGRRAPQVCGAASAPQLLRLGCILLATALIFQPFQVVAAPLAHRRPMLHVGLHVEHAGKTGDLPRDLKKVLAGGVDGDAITDGSEPEELVGQSWMHFAGRHRGTGRGTGSRQVAGEAESGEEEDVLAPRLETESKARKTRERCRGRAFLNDTWLLSAESEPVGPHPCLVLRRVCMDQSAFILYGQKYRPSKLPFPELPRLDLSSLWTQWRGNNGQNMNIMGDFWRYPEVRFRPALAGDEKNPDFSTCTIPYVYYKSHEDNIWHTMISIVPQVIGYLLEGKVNRDITYVHATLDGLPVPYPVKEIMRVVSKHEVQTLADFSARLPASTPSNATAEGRHVRCFSKAVVCHMKDMTTNFHVLPRFGGPKYMSTAPEYLYEWYKLKGLLPDNPAGFTIRKTDPSQGQKPKGPIRILIDSRRQMRKLLNHAELLKKCNQSPGLECRGWTFDDDFLKNVEAVRSCDVLVGMHGAGTGHFIFMRNDTALLEVYPYGLTTVTKGQWPQNFNPTVANFMDHRVRLYGLNVEDTSLNQPSFYETEGWTARQSWPLERDRDSILPWPVLKEMLRRIQNVKSKDEYLKMWWDGDTVLDILPGGILQRTLTVVELFAQDRYALANRTGAEALHALEEVMAILSTDSPDLVQGMERAREALRLSAEGEAETAHAIKLLDDRLTEGKKTNNTLVTMLQERHAWAVHVKETVISTIIGKQTDVFTRGDLLKLNFLSLMRK